MEPAAIMSSTNTQSMRLTKRLTTLQIDDDLYTKSRELGRRCRNQGVNSVINLVKPCERDLFDIAEAFKQILQIVEDNEPKLRQDLHIIKQKLEKSERQNEKLQKENQSLLFQLKESRNEIQQMKQQKQKQINDMSSSINQTLYKADVAHMHRKIAMEEVEKVRECFDHQVKHTYSPQYQGEFSVRSENVRNTPLTKMTKSVPKLISYDDEPVNIPVIPVSNIQTSLQQYDQMLLSQASVKNNHQNVHYLENSVQNAPQINAMPNINTIQMPPDFLCSYDERRPQNESRQRNGFEPQNEYIVNQNGPQSEYQNQYSNNQYSNNLQNNQMQNNQQQMINNPMYNNQHNVQHNNQVQQMQQNNSYQPQRQNIQQNSYQQPTLINQNSFQNSQQMPVQRQNNSSYQEQMQQTYQPALSNQNNSFQSNTQQIPNNNSFQASQAQQIPLSQNMSQKNESNGDDIYQKYNLLQEVLYSKKQYELDRDQNAYEVAKEYSRLTQERRLAAMEIAKLSEEREKIDRDKKNIDKIIGTLSQRGILLDEKKEEFLTE
ncbi:Conserved_hypothetical protein [Hexamita inflata]|uniref:Uncharacterized protein n=2 Tax=Hexamita inflata TaxID=28002 RepID=A0AA86VB12_9EUKA|nr:Conserved hypothetical protein [Hexamita inflata]